MQHVIPKGRAKYLHLKEFKKIRGGIREKESPAVEMCAPTMLFRYRIERLTYFTTDNSAVLA